MNAIRSQDGWHIPFGARMQNVVNMHSLATIHVGQNAPIQIKLNIKAGNLLAQGNKYKKPTARS
jgi:hypothetical protein